MRSGLLQGSEHTKLGAVASLSEGRCAIALSRGGHAKGYAHRDPNEDAAAFAFAADGALLAVADGHGGCEAAGFAVATLLTRFAGAWTGSEPLAAHWPARAREALALLHQQIVAGAARGGNPDARTTLALALARPGEDRLLFASVGDSHVFAVGPGRATDLAETGDELAAFLGSPSLDPEELASRARIGAVPLSTAPALALATDGLSERGIGVIAPEAAVHEVLTRAGSVRSELAPLEAARGIVDCALAAHREHRSGDNIAAAVLLPTG